MLHRSTVDSNYPLQHSQSAPVKQKVRLVPQELLKRTALETQKLELMTEVSSLKLKLTAVERDHRDNEVRPPPRRHYVGRVQWSREPRFSAALPTQSQRSVSADWRPQDLSYEAV